MNLKQLLYSLSYTKSGQYEACVGHINNIPVLSNVRKWPHLLIAGSTGSGKSVGVHQIILSLALKNKPEDLHFVMFDCKRIELNYYNDLPHTMCDVITETDDSIEKLRLLCELMESRYKLMQLYKVRDISQLPRESKLPVIIVVIDELADLILSYKRKVELYIVRLAQKARACGIHLLMATQRPSSDVLTGLIKANCPTRLAYRCVTKVDSRVILDDSGAEQLRGKGDSLFRNTDSNNLQRLQTIYVDEQGIEYFVKVLKKIYSNNLQCA